MKLLNWSARLASLLISIGTVSAQRQNGANEGENQNDAAVPGNSAISPIEDVPGLPRVLLIGDSISIGYTLQVRELLKGKANVHRPPLNCGPSHNGLRGARQGAWLGEGKWDVIHFNFGIWDSKINPKTGKVATDDTTYVGNLETIAEQLKASGAVVIFATTTPIPSSLLIAEEPGLPQPPKTRAFLDVSRKNHLATEALRAKGVLIDDLYAVIFSEREKYWRTGDLHFTPEGSQLLAQTVAKTIEDALAVRSAP